MACNFPLKAFYRMVDGKKDIVFCNSDDEWKSVDSVWRNGHFYDSKIELPCGQCIACRLEYSRQWAMRCMLEANEHKCNYFLTLTYNDENLPHSEHCVVDSETGEFVGSEYVPTLVPDHLTKFFKDLRRYFEYHFDQVGIRFFACGEYGSKYSRPHFHVILFNCDIPDLELLTRNFRGDCYYKSDIISKIWSKGFVTIGDVSFDSCAYVARYMLKKHKGKTGDFYDQNGIVPEFTRASRRPGIANAYFEKNASEIYKYDQIILTGSDGRARRMRPPLYYDRLYDIFCPDDLMRVKQLRSDRACNRTYKIMKRTSLNRDDYLALCDRNLRGAVLKLRRSIET